MTLDEDRQQITEQRDQVSYAHVHEHTNKRRRILRRFPCPCLCAFPVQLALRVKALKRQVDEAEEEVERLEGLRRKAIRDVEEQTEQKEALQTRVTALENELKYVVITQCI